MNLTVNTKSTNNLTNNKISRIIKIKQIHKINRRST